MPQSEAAAAYCQFHAKPAILLAGNVGSLVVNEDQMIYRIVVDECFEGLPTGQGRLGGLMNSYLLSGMLDRLGIRAPIGFDHRKARFYFTEEGWRQVGRLIAVEAREKGHSVRVIRRKEPRPSQVVFRDQLQLALLPSRNAKRY